MSTLFTVIFAVFAGGLGLGLANGRFAISVVILYLAVASVICFGFIGLAVYRAVADARALDAGRVDVRVGPLAGSIRHGKGGPTCSVQVDATGYFDVPHEAYTALALGRPHRMYVVPGTLSVLAIEALS